MLRIPPRAATEDEVAACHTRRYIGVVKHDVASGYEALSTGDTPLSAESLAVALKAAGGVLNAVDAVVEQRAQNAFCVVRPPGHHVTPNRGMGFCIFQQRGHRGALRATPAQCRAGAHR